MKTLACILWTDHPRMRRGSYWVLTLLVSFLAAMLSLALMYAFADTSQLRVVEEIANDPLGGVWSRLPPFLFGPIAVALIASVLTLILAIRRRRDRAHSGLDVVLYYLFSLLLPLFEVEDSVLRTLVDLVMMGWALFLLVVLGFLKGTPGPNRYGPDPREPTPEALPA